MARSRNIKPGFFCNEVLAEMEFATRLLFIGLWTEADRDGKLEDRPKKIKMSLFPDDSVDVDLMLNVLHKGNLITRYSVGDIKVIKINAWAKHQSPHHTEKKSVLPDNVKSPVNNDALTVNEQDQDGGNPADSLLLIPDSLKPDPLKEISDSGESEKRKRFTPPTFEQVDSYMQEIQKGSAEEAQKFVDFYESKGWMVGKNKMKVWRASVRTWLSKPEKKQQTKPSLFNLQGMKYESGDL